MRQFECSVAGMAAAKAHVRKELSRLGLQERIINDFAMGVSELVMNLVDHGSPKTRHFQIRVAGDNSSPAVELYADGDTSTQDDDFVTLLARHAQPPEPLSERGRGLAMILYSLPGTQVQDDAGAPGRRRFTLRP